MNSFYPPKNDTRDVNIFSNLPLVWLPLFPLLVPGNFFFYGAIFDVVSWLGLLVSCYLFCFLQPVSSRNLSIQPRFCIVFSNSYPSLMPLQTLIFSLHWFLGRCFSSSIGLRCGLRAPLFRSPQFWPSLRGSLCLNLRHFRRQDSWVPSPPS